MTKQKLLFLLLLLIGVAQGSMAQEKYAYAVLSDDGKTVTFYYDDQSSSHTNTMNIGYNGDHRGYTDAVTAVFDASFAEYRPTDTFYWFFSCQELTAIIGIEYLNTENVTNMDCMFNRCGKLDNLDLSGFKTANVTDMHAMFADCSSLTNLDLSKFNTEKVTNMASMFYGCSSLNSLDLSSFNTANVTSMSVMFTGCSALTSLDLSSFNTANVTSMYGMFSGCSSLNSLDLSRFNTASVTDMSGMFSRCSGLESLDLSGFETANVTDMSWMFCDCSSLTNLNVSNFKTASVTNMERMFNGCSNLASLDLSGFETANVTDMSWMFCDCSSLTNLNVSNFKTASVTDMSFMFYDCSSLASLDVSNFNTANVTNMQAMFNGCSGLTSLNVSNFNTANVANMERMFNGCCELTSLDLSGFETANVTDMSWMFYGCSGLTSINVMNFDFGKVTKINSMFGSCEKLQTIYCDKNLSNIESGDNVFYRCLMLAGNKGTYFSNSYIDKSYARPDKEGQPGYFVDDINYVRVDPVTFTATTIEGIEVVYTILDGETCQVGYLGGGDGKTAVSRDVIEGTLTIPEQVTYDGKTYSVIKIGEYAFRNIYRMNSIVLPSTLTAIDNFAFLNCNNLTSFELHKNVTSIGQGVLGGCIGLTTLTVEAGNANYHSPEGSNVIIETASNTLVAAAKTAVIPSDVTKIAGHVFANFNGLNLTIPSTITAIGDYAFSYIQNSTITIEAATPLVISESVFSGVNQFGWAYLRVPAGAKEAYLAAIGWSQFGADNILQGNDGTSFTATTVEGVEVTYAILDDAAKTCQVGYIDGEMDKTAIDRDAVKGTVTIPAQVTYNGIVYNVVKIGKYAFYGVGMNSIVLPSTLEAIDENAFEYCYGLNAFTLPKNVTTIGQRSLSGCSNLATLTVEAGNTKYSSPEGSNVIVESASNTLVAVAAKTAVIPATVTNIPDNQFESFEGLNLTIPSTITSIGNRAFANIRNSTITVENETPMVINENVFGGVSGRNNYLRVPAGSKDAYLAATGWSQFGADNILSGNDGTTFTATTAEGVEVTYTILDDAAKTCQVGYIDGSSDKTAVNRDVVKGTVTIPAQVTYNGNTYNVVKVGRYAFWNAYDLNSIVLPSTLEAIDDYAFQYCGGLNTFTLPKNVTRIGVRSLSGCSNLVTLTVEAGNAKYSSPEGSNVIIETSSNTLVAIAKAAVIPATVTEIPDNLFESSDGLNLTIPSTITTIGNRAFAYIRNSTITVENETPMVINENVFDGVSGRNNYLRVPAGSKDAYLNATGWSQFGADNILSGNDGTSFTATTVEGFDVIYTILDDAAKTCQVGYLDGNYDKTAIDREAVRGMVTIPEQVTYNGAAYKVIKVGRYAFRNAFRMNSIVLPSTLESIDEYAFERCNALNAFTLPKNVTSIGQRALIGLSRLNELTVEAGNAKYSSPEGSNVIIETASNTLVAAAKTAVIPATVTEIPDNMFEDFNGLNLTIPSTITSIGNRAFAYIHNSTITVENETPMELYENVFDGVSGGNNILRVPVGSKDAYLIATGWNQFGADNILSGNDGTTFTATTVEGVEVTYTILDDAAKTCQVGYLDGGSEKTAVNHNIVPGTITIPSQVTYDGNTYNVVKVGKWAFVNGYRMNTLNLPSTLKTIDDYAFFNCTALKSFTLPKDVTSIGQDALRYCNGLTTLTVEAGNAMYSSPEGSNVIVETSSNRLVASANTAVIPAAVTEISGIFRDYDGLNLTIPSTVTAISNRAFATIRNSIIIVESATPLEISKEVFDLLNQDGYDNNYLRVPAGAKDAYLAATGWNQFGADYILEGNEGNTFTATTTEGVEVTYTILDDAAKTCQVGYIYGTKNYAVDRDAVKGTAVTIPEEANGYKVVKIGYNSLFGVVGTSVSIPLTVKEIGKMAFRQIASANITIPTSVTSIDNYAFFAIKNSTITVGWDTPIEIDETVFRNVNESENGASTLVVPDGTKAAYLAATGWSQFGADYIIEASEFNKVVIVETEDGSVIKTEIEAEVTNADAKEVKITSASIPESEGSATAVAIPATYEIDGVTYSVTSIADNAFAGKTEITDIYLPVTDKAIEIGENALKIDGENIATIHSPMALLDDYAQNLFLKQNVEAGKLMATVKAPNKYWTFSCGIDVVIPENIKVYTCMIANSTEVKITEIDEALLTVDGQRIIKANNGVLVACPDDDTANAYDIVAASNVKAATGDAKSYGEDNWLEPVVESKNYSANDYYVLKDGEFHVIIANDSKVPACKAVLRKPAGVAATRSLTIVGDGTTSIGERTKVDGAADEWFTISGQRISKPTTKGLYINNGKKVIIK